MKGERPACSGEASEPAGTLADRHVGQPGQNIGLQFQQAAHRTCERRTSGFSHLVMILTEPQASFEKNEESAHEAGWTLEGSACKACIHIWAVFIVCLVP